MALHTFENVRPLKFSVCYGSRKIVAIEHAHVTCSGDLASKSYTTSAFEQVPSRSLMDESSEYIGGDLLRC